MYATETKPAGPAAVAAMGIVVTVLVVSGLPILLASELETAWALVLASILVFLTVPALRRQAAEEADPRLFWLLLVALLLKLVGAAVRHYVAFEIYGGRADAGDYHDWGVRLYPAFRSGDFDTGFPSLTSTHFIQFLTGVVYAITGPSLLGGFLFYSWLGFWGLLFFYRAFTLAVPDGRPRTYARLLFFLPSLLFWPSSIGKESWMLFTLGLGALGAAHALSGRTLKGASLAGIGVWLAAIVRPHFAGLMALALVFGYVLRRPRRDLGTLGPLAKGIVIAGLAAFAVVFVSKAERFLQERGIHPEEGVTTALQETSERTDEGRSGFAPSILDSPARAPVAVATVLFRPLIVEAHNTQALVAGAEATFLFLVSLFKLRSVVGALKSVRRQPYVAFALAYTGLLILALSSIANFGILARQRIQLLPLYLVLLSLRPPSKGRTRAVGV